MFLHSEAAKIDGIFFLSFFVSHVLENVDKKYQISIINGYNESRKGGKLVDVEAWRTRGFCWHFYANLSFY